MAVDQEGNLSRRLAVVAPNSGNMVKIGGNVQADQCKLVRLTTQGLGAAISVGGNVQIQNCTGGSGYDAGAGGTITIGGDFACDNNSAGCIANVGSVRGNVQVNNNSGRGADVDSSNVSGN